MLTFGLNGILPTMVDAFTHNLLSAAGKVDLTVTSAYNQPFLPDVIDRLRACRRSRPSAPGYSGRCRSPAARTLRPTPSLRWWWSESTSPTVRGVRDFPLEAGRMLARATMPRSC